MPIDISSGTLFIQGPGEQDWSVLGEISEMTFDDEPDRDPMGYIIKTGAAVLTIKARMNKWQSWQLSGLQKIVLDCCPDRRVRFLILHGKKERTRKKNLARLIRILEKEASRT